MITFVAGRSDCPAYPIAIEAMRRSVSPGLIKQDHRSGGISEVMVFVSPSNDNLDCIAEAARANSKILFFGALTPEIAALCGLRSVESLSPEWANAAHCPAAPTHGTSESPARIIWQNHPLAGIVPFPVRPFARFDFACEWNNLGYGKITADGGPWSLAIQAHVEDAEILATAIAPGYTEPTAYATVLDTQSSSILWWNRPVGPVDSVEWAVVESFLADWRHADRPCVPIIREIPYEVDALVTMRLDCDEDIASARQLFKFYEERDLPFSLAVKTGQEEGHRHLELLSEVLAAGGAVLSHSVTHADNWGGSGEACYNEARESAAWLEQRLPGIKVRYAVSPFHQNPPYVYDALMRAGLEGFVGGIIANDPEALLARGGTLPSDTTQIVTHSQQCMLHGDCLLAQGDALQIPKQAFLAAMATETLFGYLDHPLSTRYDYGWGTEENRIARHEELVQFIDEQTVDRRIVWLNEEEALDWIAAKMRLNIVRNDGGFELAAGSYSTPVRNLSFSVRWRGETHSLQEFVHAST